MNLPLIKQWIIRWESIRYQAYDDKNGKPITPTSVILGNPTIGVGFNLKNSNAKSVLASAEADYTTIMNGTSVLTPAQVDTILGISINIAQISVRRLCPDFDTYTDNQQLVLTDIVFNMGETTFSKFTGTLNYIHQRLWPQAALNLQNSAWFHQVGSLLCERGGADVAVLSGKEVPEDILETIHS